MLQLVVLNRSRQSEDLEPVGMEASFVRLKTCLRELYILNGSEWEEFKGLLSQKEKENFSVYKNYQALEYLIQVLAGLESPVLGETEVFGQFKKQVLPQLKKRKDLSDPIQFVLSVVKSIRTKHLKSHGSQTYGSLVRRLLKGESHVLFIGAGVLTESIYPWLTNHKKMMFSVRDTNKFLKNKILGKEVAFDIQENLKFDFPLNVVVCAPVSAAVIENHLKGLKINSIIDLREESKEDPLNLKGLYYNLQNVFSEIKENNQSNKKLIKKINQDIVSEIDSRYVKYRPFGWEDLCL